MKFKRFSVAIIAVMASASLAGAEMKKKAITVQTPLEKQVRL